MCRRVKKSDKRGTREQRSTVAVLRLTCPSRVYVRYMHRSNNLSQINVILIMMESELDCPVCHRLAPDRNTTSTSSV